MAIVYDEGRTASFTREGVKVVRRLRVTPYNEIGYVVDLLLGGARIIGDTLYRLPPARDPWYPWCICTSVDEEEGVGAYTGGVATGLTDAIRRTTYSEGARLTVTYETPAGGQGSFDPRDPFDENPPGQPGQPPNGNPVEPTAQQEIELASDQYDFRAQHLTMEGSHLAWTDATGSRNDGLLSTSNSFATKTIPMIDLTLVRHHVVRPPFNAIHALLGHVNAGAITKGRRTWPAETMRFDGLKSSRQVTSFGIKHFQLTYQFAAFLLRDILQTGDRNFVGWLRKYRWDTTGGGRWWYVGLASNLNKGIYEYDTEYSQTISGASVSGFNLLFHPKAT